MRVTVKIIGGLSQRLGFGERDVEVSEGMTLGALLTELHVDDGTPRIVTRNGRQVASGDTLSDGDRIVISHLYSGG